MLVFAFIDLAYNVPGSRNKDDLGSDVFTSENMRDKEKILGNVMKPGTHENVFYSQLPVVLWYGAFVFQFTEELTIIASDRENIGSESKGTKLLNIGRCSTQR